jgi:hypothetical protein
MATGNTLFNEGRILADTKWKKYSRAITEGYKRTHQGKAPSSNILATTAMMLENTDKMIKRMDETTKVVNIGNFVDYGFGIVTAVMPALVANEIVSVQPLKARTGEIFYLEYKRGNQKGNLAKGSTFISPFTGTSDDTTYSSENVTGETVQDLEVSTDPVSAQASLSYIPVKPGTLTIQDATVSYVDDGNGNIVLAAGSTNADYTNGTVNYETGAVVMNFAKVDSAVQLIADYEFDFRSQGIDARIPEVDLQLSSTSITSTTRKLRARWLFDAAYELQNVHGVDAEQELSTALAAEVRHEIDGEIMNDILVQAAAGNVEFSWSKTTQPNVPFVDYKDTFVDLLIKMSNAIFYDTHRAEGNFIVAGINVSSLIESLGARFKPNKNGLKAGPHVIGELDGRWTVIKNPFYPQDSFVVGYKGQSYLEGGYVYAPYIPLYTTPAVMLDDFVSRRGVMTSYGKKMLNPHFYARGVITA